MNNNNEQDLMLNQKIAKREKIDTILAYILLVILVGCIGLVLCLKFFGGEDEPPVDEYVPTYISLGEISNSLNDSTLANRYMNDGASFGSSVNGNSISVIYVKDDVNLNLEMPVVGNELMIDIPNENSDIVTDVYEEIANIVCVYYGNEEKYCRNTLENMTSDGLDGIRFDSNEDNTTVYITTTKSYTVNNYIVYNEVTELDINDSDFVLNLSDAKIYNVNVATSDVNVRFAGTVDRLNNDTSDISVGVKLYDADGNVLAENKYEFNEENVLESTGTFEITFLLSDTLRLADISSYIIETIK